MGKLIIPWPHKDLSPNSRKRHRHSTDTRKAYKKACWVLAKEAKFQARHLDITFCAPDGRRRDLDNMLGAIKYGIDGIALAMGCDDSEFEYTIRKGKPCRPDGAVIIRAGEDIFDVPYRGVVS